MQFNRRVSQIRAPLAACRERAGRYNRLLGVLYVFKHKPQYVLIHVPYTRIVDLWHISDVPP